MSERTLTWSYGGGTQSVAIAVLVKRGLLPRPAHVIMADTGREASETWEYTDRYVRPLLKPLGLDVEIAPHSLSKVGLYDRKGDGLLIPAYTKTGILPTFCSSEWKKAVFGRYLRSLGYGPSRPVRTWVGISKDEIGRAKPSSTDWQEFHWPLLLDVTMSRRECVALVEDEGLPTPPKSSCWMCPYRRNSQWRKLRDEYPEDWAKAVALDEEIRAKDTRDGVWLHDSRTPLAEADLSDPDPQLSFLFGEVEGCDSGLCWV
jgi:hypothetical protein